MRSLDQVRGHRGAHCDRLRLQDFCLAAYLSRPPHLLLKVPRQDRLDLDLKRIGRDVTEESNRVADHGLRLFEPARLCVDALQLGHTDRPPVAHPLATSRICPHLLHQPRPSSSSNALKMACTVISLISRCRGTVTFVLPHCQTSCRPPCLTRRHALPCAAAAR